MSTLSKDLRDKLAASFYVTAIEIDQVLQSEKTIKFSFKTSDEKILESVIMIHYHHRKKD